MNIEIIEVNGTTIAELVSDEIIIVEPQDALDILAEAEVFNPSRDFSVRQLSLLSTNSKSLQDFSFL